MTRRRLSTRDRVRIFDAACGVCCFCGGTIDGTREAWDLHHAIELELGGEDDESNMLPSHAKCHRAHTAAHSAPTIAKAKRNEARNIGAKAPSSRPIPGGRNDPRKRKIGGGWEWRDGRADGR